VKTPVEPHCHIQSLDSASTPERFAQREMELGTGYITTTDHGTMEVTRTLYDMCAKGGKYHGKLKPILGLEGYVRDDNCPILVPKYGADFKKNFKYAHVTLHAVDEAAYFTLVKKLSDADMRAEWHGQERKPLFSWSDLEELGAANITATSGCLIGMVGRHLMANNDPQSAVKYYEKLRSIVRPGNFYVELFPHTTDKYYQSAVVLTYEGDKTASLPSWKKVKTAGAELTAEDLAADFKRDARAAAKKHVSVLEVMNNRKWDASVQYLDISLVELKEGFVYNECKPWCNHSDYQLEVNRFLYALAKKYGDKILVSGDSHFAYPDEFALQDIRLNGWRFAESHHRMSGDESYAHFKAKLGVSEALFQEWTENSYEWAAKFDNFSFTPRASLPTKFYPKDTLRFTMQKIQEHGRMNWNDPIQVDRLKTEINLLHKNGTIDLLPYFLMCEELTSLYTRNGRILGSGRGSAAGVRLAYLLGITHRDPLVDGLSLDRFLTIDRIASGKMPDIDMDFPDRELLVGADGNSGYLRERFGDCVAQMSTDITLKLKSAIKDVHRFKEGYVSAEINELTKKLPDEPQGVNSRDFVLGYEIDGTQYPGLIEYNKDIQNYIAKYPMYWDNLVLPLLGTTKTKSKHPCGFLIGNDPVDSYIPLTTVNDVRVTAFTAPAVEASGGLKVDLLVVNSVRDIGKAIQLIQDRHGGADWAAMRAKTDTIQLVKSESGNIPYGMAIPFKGKLLNVWNLPEDPNVFRDICEGRVETVFQLDAGAARQGLRHFPVIDGQPTLKSITDLAVFTSLDRPGPLDAYVSDEHGNKHNMLVEYARRARGEKPIGAIPELDRMFPETFGALCFQEQIQKLFQEVGQTTGIEANNFRQRIGKKKITEVRKKDEPLFMKGAIPTLGEESAKRIWEMMVTWGQYGFNKSHAVCYMVTSYACAWLKHHYPLEWWTSVLSNADRNDVNEKFWRYIGPMVLMPSVAKLHSEFTIEGDKIRAPVWLIHGIGEKAHRLLTQLGPYTDIEDMLRKIDNWRIANSTSVVKTDKKTGKMVQSQKKAHNPINNTIIRKLIVCGVLDDLFPAEKDGLPVDITDKLSMFDAAIAKISGKKVKPSAIKFSLMDEIARYQYVKSIMPAYSAPLVEMFKRKTPDRFSTRLVHGVANYRDVNVVEYTAKDGTKYTVCDGKQFEWLENLDTLPDSELNIAVPAYVLDQKVFAYSGGAKEACKLILDIEGHRREFVKWPSKTEGLPPEFREPLKGAFVMATFGRRKAADSFFFREIEVIAYANNNEETPTDD
jgi:DNA polymerase III alpha subunit